MNFFEKDGVLCAIRPEHVKVKDMQDNVPEGWLSAEIIREELLGAIKALYLPAGAQKMIASVDVGIMFDGRAVMVKPEPDRIITFN